MTATPVRKMIGVQVRTGPAHNPQGNARALLRLAAVRGATIVASSFAVEEAVRDINLEFPEYAVELTALLERLVLGP